MKRKFVSFRIGVSLCFILSLMPSILFAAEYSLDDLYRIALTESPKLKVAEENLTIAKLDKDQVFSYLLPRVTALSSFTVYNAQVTGLTGSLVQPLNATIGW